MQDATDPDGRLVSRVVTLTPEDGEALAAKLSASIDLLAILTTAAASHSPAVQDALDTLTTLVALLCHDRYLHERRNAAVGASHLMGLRGRAFTLFPELIRERVERVIDECHPRHLFELERFLIVTDGHWPEPVR